MSAAKLPPYPGNPEGHLVESDFEGRDMIELDLSHFSSKLGNFPRLRSLRRQFLLFAECSRPCCRPFVWPSKNDPR
jgi:hypothetical protein